MKAKPIQPTLINFKWRKTVHYTLIFTIILIQIILGGFLYNEFVNKKNVQFIKNQLQEMKSVENLTENSKKELYFAQNSLQKYVINRDKKDLDNYFSSINKLRQKLQLIDSSEQKNLKFSNIINSQTKDLRKIKDLKTLIDSTYKASNQISTKIPKSQPQLKKYKAEYKLEPPEIKTETFSDTIKKKNMIGRLKDAISGKENVRKDSTVVTVKQKNIQFQNKLQAELDSVMNSVNNHYILEIQKIKLIEEQSMVDKDDSNRDTASMYGKLLLFGNDLMNTYDYAVKKSRKDLEIELAKVNSKTNIIRNYLILGLMALMILVSILIIYFTRIAFIYEHKLKIANDQITENLNFKNRILGMLSHELRSPLKIIDLFINRIKNKTKDEQIKDYLKSISFTNNTLLMQASQILEYTKNQHVENKLNLEVFTLKNEINSILTAIEPYIKTRNNQFDIEENIDPNIIVNSDRTKINQIFLNILGNANKFTENGQISVITKTEDAKNGFINLKTIISDTGVGISQSDLQQIFEPYYQGILSDGIENLGAGLGLSLCKEIVELFDGNISVQSELGKGSTVTFSINLKMENAATK